MTKKSYKISSLRTVGTFMNGRACSDTLFHVINRAFDNRFTHEEPATMPFAGGIMQHGYQCGMLWGAAVAAGAQAYRQYGSGPQAEAKAICAAKRLVESFRSLNENINCLEITELDNTSTTMEMVMYFLIKGGAVGCFHRAARYAPVAFSAIQAAFSEDQSESLASPVSCASLLANNMGLSDEHRIMVAGLAGGIGLSGGGCGALGAALWIVSMKSLKEGEKLDFKTPAATAVIERFLSCTDYEFECDKIVGRRFASISDHAAYVRDGGCSKIIEVLAAR